MLENMFVGRPPGSYDRILDFSRAITGNLFFVPTATFLEDVSQGVTPAAQPAIEAPVPVPEPSQPILPVPDGSLGIGSLKGKPR
jgi:putative iron-dependent peroxidase